MGIVTAMTGLPGFLGLFIGAWVDRRRRLPVLIGSDLGRAALIALIPTAYFLDVLSIGLVYVVAFGMGLFTMAFSIGYRSLLPTVVKRSELVEANSKLEFAGSGTSALGPGIGGGLVDAISGPATLLFGAGSYLLSAVLFRSIRVTENMGQDRSRQGDETGSIRAGIDFFRRNRVLIGIAGSQATLVTFSAGFMSIGLLYKVNELEITPAVLGLIISAGSIGSIFGAMAATRMSKRVGIGSAMAGGLLIVAITEAVLPIVDGPIVFIAIVLATAIVVGDGGNVIYSITQMSLRQSATPDHFQGRISSIFATFVRLGWPLGGLLSGFLAELFDLRTALFIGAAGTATAAIWLTLGGIWRTGEIYKSEARSAK